jgi:hypothetical protein
MTDMKKCGTFLVQIADGDRECVILRERPSDAVVLSLFALIPRQPDCSEYRFVVPTTDVILAFNRFGNDPWVVDGWVWYPRRFSRRAPHTPLKRVVKDGFGFRSSLNFGDHKELISWLRASMGFPPDFAMAPFNWYPMDAIGSGPDESL